MYFVNLIKENYSDKKYDIFVDMDGVIADYDVGNPLDFFNKRPLNNNINVLKEISKLENITLHILSICRKDSQIEEKNIWLDKYAPFFTNRNILSKETFAGVTSSDLKVNFLKNFKENNQTNIILIDDDNFIIKEVKKNISDVILFQDSSLQD